MSSREPSKPAQSAKGRRAAADRQARLADELRANLRKRKDQARSRAGQEQSSPGKAANGPPDVASGDRAGTPPNSGEA